MPKPWTGKEQKECSLVYSTEGMKAAMEATGRSSESIYEKMRKMSVRSASDGSENLKSNIRKWFCEDVALMFEFSSSGLPVRIIAEYFDTTRGAITGTMSNARKNGFDAYPLRSQ